jgi:hypothetical protein
MTRSRLALILVALLLAAPAFAQTNLTGDWDVTITSPQGANSVKATLKQDGDKVSGILKSAMGELPFTGGTVTGDELKFAFTVPVQGQMLEITLTGKVDGATITGKAEFGGFGEGDWIAKRAAAETAAAPAAAPAAPAPAATTAAAKIGGAAGQWDLVFKTPNGDFPAGASFTEDNGKITGTISSQLGDTPVTGTIEGKSLKLSFTAVTPQGSMPITLTGDVDGDTIVKGQAEITGMGTMEWTGKKKQ